MTCRSRWTCPPSSSLAMKGLTPCGAALSTAARSEPILLRAPPPRMTIPPMPLRAQRRPASGLRAGTLQKTSCAASRRLDQPASSDGAGWLGDAVGRRRRCGDGRGVGGGALAGRLGRALRRAAERGGRRRRDGDENERPAEGMASHDSATVPSHARFATGRVRCHGPREEPGCSDARPDRSWSIWRAGARQRDRADLGRAPRSGAALARACAPRAASPPARSTTPWSATGRRSSRTRCARAPATSLGALERSAATAFYTIFCEDERGAWHRQARLKLDTRDPALGRRAEGDFEAETRAPAGATRARSTGAGSGRHAGRHLRL